MYTILAHSPIFHGLTPELIEQVISRHHHQVNQFNEGEMIAQSGESCDRLMIVIEGLVKGEMIEPSGKTITIEERGAGMPLAPSFIFGQTNRFPVNIIAIRRSKVITFSKQEFVRLMMEDEKILNNFLDVIATRTQFLTSKIRFLSFRTIKGKIASFLVNLSQNNTLRVINLRHSQQEMADLFGVTRPSLARAMSELEQDGIIKAERKDITILDFERLKKSVE